MEAVGPYRVVKELGRGAMGIVFEAFDPEIGRTVALKVIRHQEFATANEEAQLKLRFARECSAAGRLSHPNIVTIYHRGEQDGMQYLVMEYITGSSLEALMTRPAPLNPDTALSILKQIAAALDYAHGQGIVHRDIKPANILVKPDGAVKLTDFGIARIASQTMTQTGVTMGTPSYMAPEQIMASRVDGLADQFSLAVVAYQMLSGNLPFEAPSYEALMFKIIHGEPRPFGEVNSSLPAAVSAAIGRGLAKDPGQRYPNCAEFVTRLAVALAPPIPAIPIPHRAVEEQTATPFVSRRWPLIAACAVLAAAAGVWFVSRGSKVPRKQEHAAVSSVAPPVANPNPAPAQSPPKPSVDPVSGSPAGSSSELPRSTTSAREPIANGSAPGDTSVETTKGNSNHVPGVIHEVLPDLSEQARRTIRGVVRVNVLAGVDAAGRVTSTTLESQSSRYYADLAMQAAGQWQFEPAQAPGSWILRFEFTSTGVTVHPLSVRPSRVTGTPVEPPRPAPQAGATKVNEKDGLKYVWIPPGTFQMGCSAGDAECQDVEKPAHPVTLTKGFWIGQTPVTQEAYQRVVGHNPSTFKGDKLPVVWVTWSEAENYCQAAGMRLATESEWEYAARGGSTANRYGDLERIGWYGNNIGAGEGPHAVGQKMANAFGLYDMLGNVWQWVADWYSEYPAGPQRDPAGPASGQRHVLRGSAAGFNRRTARVSSRLEKEPQFRSNFSGIRCAGN